MVPAVGVEPTRMISAADFKSAGSPHSPMLAYLVPPPGLEPGTYRL